MTTTEPINIPEPITTQEPTIIVDNPAQDTAVNTPAPDEPIAAVPTPSKPQRRTSRMVKWYGLGGQSPDKTTLVVNGQSFTPGGNADGSTDVPVNAQQVESLRSNGHIFEDDVSLTPGG